MNVSDLRQKFSSLGATWDGEGTHFAIFSENATGVELCLFDGQEREHRLPLRRGESYIWSAYLERVTPGQKYGFRVDGPYKPERGHLFNRSKLLVDPYAKAIAGDVIYGQDLFNYNLSDPTKAPSIPCMSLDNAALIPKSVVINDSFNWDGDRQLQIPWTETVIYEVHLKGFTQLHPHIPSHLRGTYRGLAHPVAINYLKSLGVTAVELLPVHHIFPFPQFLAEKGLRDYWGYRTLGFFAPYSGYSASGMAGEQVTEFKEMVKSLHRAGIEVILDVVYNHSAEGNPSEPPLFLRGIDNAVYYVLDADNPAEYLDTTGCGNSLNISHPQVLKLIVDSLRYWVTEMHVDGFRFDEAPTLAREGLSSEYQIQLALNSQESQSFLEKITQIKYDRGAAFFDIIHQDPILSQVKLIAEAWDAGDGGYQVGNFPLLWSEWNGKYRDIMRDFWRGEAVNKEEFIKRFLGSPDLYQHQGKYPRSSINFMTCHDGFTLNDLVSYEEKHNLANGEQDRDGSTDNHSWNCGVEGATDDPEVLELRERQKRNFLTTLLLSQGVPMVLGGDEMGRTQQGNNNAYCQDNGEFSWFNWDLKEQQAAFRQFTADLIRFRQSNPIFCQSDWLDREKDVLWFDAEGKEIGEQELEGDNVLGICLRGEFIFLFNGHGEDREFILPPELEGEGWRVVIDTAGSGFVLGEASYTLVQARSVVVWQKAGEVERLITNQPDED